MGIILLSNHLSSNREEMKTRHGALTAALHQLAERVFRSRCSGTFIGEVTKAPRSAAAGPPDDSTQRVITGLGIAGHFNVDCPTHFTIVILLFARFFNIAGNFNRRPIGLGRFDSQSGRFGDHDQRRLGNIVWIFVRQCVNVPTGRGIGVDDQPRNTTRRCHSRSQHSGQCGLRTRWLVTGVQAESVEFGCGAPTPISFDTAAVLPASCAATTVIRVHRCPGERQTCNPAA